MFEPLQASWNIIRKGADFERLAFNLGVSEALVRLMRNRGLKTEEEMAHFLHPDIQDMYSPWNLKDMEKSVSILAEKIAENKPVRIIGDYDVDGVMASYILETGLERLGGIVSVKIPHRIHDGYGVRESMIRQAWDDGIDTILTCDNGSKAVDEFALALDLGMTVIITDHHEYALDEASGGYLYPSCHAMINPHQAECSYPNKDICGAGLALKLVTALYEHFQVDERELEDLLIMAALATVADVVSLMGENRSLVKHGLDLLPYTNHTGMKALLEETGFYGKKITSYHVGFRIAPCINAAGRLESADLALDLLRCQNPEQAKDLAKRLLELNDKRKSMTEEMVKRAIEIVEKDDPDRSAIIGSAPQLYDGVNDLDRVLLVYLPECHESLAGIIAGRLKNRYYRPVYVLTDAKEGIKGSGRSTKEYDMYRELEKADPYLDRYGGHPGAAGLSLSANHIENLRFCLNQNCTLTKKELTPKISIDLLMPLAYVSVSLIDQLDMLEPFGEDNPNPLFVCRNLHILDARIVGNDNKIVKMRVCDDSMRRLGNRSIEAIYYGDEEEFMKDLGKRKMIYAVIYQPSINDFGGIQSLQIIIKHYRMDGPTSRS